MKFALAGQAEAIVTILTELRRRADTGEAIGAAWFDLVIPMAAAVAAQLRQDEAFEMLGAGPPFEQPGSRPT